MRHRQLLAFKRGPTVDLRLGELVVEVTDDRVHLGVAAETEYFSWEEWHDFAQRVEHAISWIEEHTPADADGRSYEVGADQ